MALGWFLLGALATAVLAGSANDGEDYGYYIPREHKRCAACGTHDVSVYIISKNSNYMKLLFVCSDCGRKWTKTYHIG